MKVLGPYHVFDEIWVEFVHEGFKPLSFDKFDRCSDPYELIAFINTHMDIIGAPESLKFNMLSGTLRDGALRLYIGASISNYQELVEKLIFQFPAIRHKKMSTTR